MAPVSTTTISVIVRDLTGTFQFHRENPDAPLGDREYGSVFIYGRTYRGFARRVGPGIYEFTI